MEEKQFTEMRGDIDNLKKVVVLFNKTLEKQNERIANLEKGAGVAVSNSQSDPIDMMRTSSSATDQSQGNDVAKNTSEESSGALLDWMAVDWPMKVGALLLLLGMGWFVSYAFLNNWIGPIGRITLGLLFGASVLLLGQWRFRAFSGQGSVFMGLGAVIIFMTVFAARTVYMFFTPTAALAMMVLVVSYIAFVSVMYRSLALSCISLIAGSIAPLLTAGDSGFAPLFTYLLALSLGTFAVASKTGQRVLLIILLAILFMYSAPYTIGFARVDMPTAFLFAFLFAASFFAANFLAMIKNGKIDSQDIIISGFNSISFLMWIRVAVLDEWKGFVALAVAFALSLMAYAIARSGDAAREFAYTRFASAFLFLVAATVFEFSGTTLTIAFLVEASFAVILALKALNDVRAARQLSLLLVIPGIMSLQNLANYFVSREVFTKDFFVIVLAIVVLFVLGSMMRSEQSDADNDENVSLGTSFSVIASVYALFLVWNVLHIALYSDAIATFLALVIYMLLGTMLYAKGKSTGNANSVRAGSALFVLVIARLLLVDVWDMSLGGRVVTFFIVGALFMSTAFLGKGSSK